MEGLGHHSPTLFRDLPRLHGPVVIVSLGEALSWMRRQDLGVGPVLSLVLDPLVIAPVDHPVCPIGNQTSLVCLSLFQRVPMRTIKGLWGCRRGEGREGPGYLTTCSSTGLLVLLRPPC